MSVRFKPLREDRKPDEDYGRLTGYAVQVNSERVTIGYLRIHEDGHLFGYAPDEMLCRNAGADLQGVFWPMSYWSAVISNRSKEPPLMFRY